MVGYFRDEAATDACLDGNGWLDTGDMGYMSDGYIYIVGRAKDMIIINGKNHWPQDIEWAVEQLPGFKAGDIAAFAITTPGGEETPAVLVQCRTSDAAERGRLRDAIRDRVRAITGMNCVIELVPPRTLPRTSSGKLSRAKGPQPVPVRRDSALRYRRLAPFGRRWCGRRLQCAKAADSPASTQPRTPKCAA
jgi:fatty-acyl-CoA synthase